jgi:hypothetical protein
MTSGGRVAGRKIFVCYRREDSAGHAGRLYDRLTMRFPGRVFMDVAGIGLGTRWAEVIEQTLASCEVALLLIGRRWLERAADGTRRLDDADDPLRAEIATALRLKLKIVPVLVGGAAMPDRADLPPDVAALADWQAMRVDDDDFDHDATRLTRALEGQLGDEGVDPHLEEAAARRAQIDRLFDDAASAVRSSAWVTAAQTLRAILSLDPGNQRALLELREVERRSAKAYGQGQAAPVVARPGRWAALGALGAVAIIGVVGAAVLIITLLVMYSDQSDMLENDYVSGGPVGSVRGPVDGPADGPAHGVVDDSVNEPVDESVDEAVGAYGVRPGGASPSALVGEYLLAAYSQQGVRLPVVGRLTLSDAGQGRLQFYTQASNQATGAAFWYRGYLQQQNGMWTTTTTESSDRQAGTATTPTGVEFDGTTLVTTNAFGEVTVWQKQ